GMALEQSGDAEGARAQYLKALSLAPQDYVAQANLARLGYLRGDNRAAIAAFRKAIALNREYADAYSGLGVVYHHQGYREQAVVQLQKALQKNPGYAGAQIGAHLPRRGKTAAGHGRIPTRHRL
ncbi:MAG: tetratricopeptide repeat protein, partial [Calditrichaeota bacterium]|nr:tetratricopeptide repeat protein [Calditrichota bacterium]